MQELRVGQKVTVSRIFRQEDFDRFAALSGDSNPIHVDPAFAAKTRFGRTLCHGMLLFSTLSGVIGTQFPGPGTILLGQQLKFPGPAFTDEPLDIEIEVLGRWQRLALLAATIRRPNGEPSLEGKTLVSI